MKSNEAAEGNENACFSAHFSGKTGTSTGADNGRAVCFLPSPGEAFSRSQAGLPAWLPPQEHLPSDFFASGCTDFPRHMLPCCFTVAGTAPVLHRLPMLAEHARVRRRASLRTCVGCSFVTDIIHADGALVNLLRFLDTFPAICYNSDGRNRTCGFHPFSLHIISHTRCEFPFQA